MYTVSRKRCLSTVDLTKPLIRKGRRSYAANQCVLGLSGGMQRLHCRSTDREGSRGLVIDCRLLIPLETRHCKAEGVWPDAVGLVELVYDISSFRSSTTAQEAPGLFSVTDATL